ncbi:Uma2 family endonuclease [Streptomyces sp. FH025]|uniref:Uma2 family endonuclease n=1 Tax=Streptomyces sp. FH025 TaxID=2815937 RepID=UPI001A9FC87E|nr:Uma2 family endonuclease [Streptomyces sp. FH025]MBO1418573.1 Uma2 family endonuclease [Streptomyces sp. FH025]
MSSVVASGRWVLPESPYALWARGELDDHLGLPEVLRVEVIGGEFMVTPYPSFGHAATSSDIQEAVFRAEFTKSCFRWRAVQAVGLDLAKIGDGYVPDIVVMASEVESAIMSEAKDRYLRPADISLVAEVTAPFSAHNDRCAKRRGYARAGVPYYLLVDRDPQQPGITLFGGPDSYRVLGEWEFGESVRLPEPFDFEIDSKRWNPWAE